MKKKIHIDQLRPGMYVATTNLSWLKLPFFRKRIPSQTTIDKLRASGVQEVVIDLAKGDDVGQGAESRSVDPFDHPDLLVENINQSVLVHNQVLQQTKDLMEQVRAGKEIDARQADTQVGLMIDQLIEDPQSMLCISVLKNSDEYTYDHCVNTAILALFVGRSMNLPERELMVLGKGMLLHDIGKCMIPHSILTKPGRLSAEEVMVVKSHVNKGVAYLRKTDHIEKQVLTMVTQHHERLDGSGYPDGLRGSQIDPMGRLAGLLDVYDAMIHENHYKDSDDPTTVLKQLAEGVDTAYDATAFKALSESIGIYPPGTILMLDTGEMALSFHPNARNPYRPRVLLLTAKDGSFYSQPTPICLTDLEPDEKTYKRSILTTMSLEDTNFNPFKILKSYAPQQAEP